VTLVPPSSLSTGLPLGLTGATAATRYVGATASGAPASGTFAVGDYIIDQTGTIYICTTAGTPGTWTQVGGSSAFAGCRLRNSAAQAVANSTVVPITFDTETYDVGGYHSVAALTSRITIPAGKDGYYLVAGTVEFASTAGGQRFVAIYLNGATFIAIEDQINVANQGASRVAVTTEYHLVAGDFVELVAFQDSGGSINSVANDPWSPIFWCDYRGA
jgi:hypothetical protein